MRSSVALLGTPVGDIPFLFDIAAVFHGFSCFLFQHFPELRKFDSGTFPRNV